MNIEELVGKTLVSITGKKHDDEIIFTTANTSYKMYHYQECCESVVLEDINGDWDDLLNTPILHAFENTNSDDVNNEHDSVTWTFYTLRTIKGTVVIRWCGSSNGYYGESVDFIEGK